MLRIVRLFYRPCKKWKYGRQFVICGEEQIHQVVNGEGDDWIGCGNPEKPETLSYPIVDFSDVPVHYGYWGRGRQSAVRGPQKMANIAWSKASQAASPTRGMS